MSIKTISEGSNYTAVNLGKFSELNQYVLDGPGGAKIPGKVFIGKPTKMSGAEISYTSMPPGASVPFFHAHYKHEESYLIISGTGEYQVDDHVFPIEEGSVVRVGTGASRNLKNTGTVPLVFLCVQTMENSYKSDIPNECDITKTEPKFH